MGKLGLDVSVGIAICYGLDIQGNKSWRGQAFPHPSKLVQGLNQLPTLRIPCHSRAESGLGVELTTKPHLSLRLKKE
jgi:hypothetical protein